MDTITRNSIRWSLPRECEGFHTHGSSIQNLLNAEGSHEALLHGLPAGHDVINVHRLVQDGSRLQVPALLNKVVSKLLN